MLKVSKNWSYDVTETEELRLTKGNFNETRADNNLMRSLRSTSVPRSTFAKSRLHLKDWCLGTDIAKIIGLQALKFNTTVGLRCRAAYPLGWSR